jgi:prefoldin subunit 5
MINSVYHIKGEETMDDIIADLKNQIQAIEDAKQQLTETQQELRETICYFQMALEGKAND